LAPKQLDEWADMEQRLSMPRQPRLDTPGALHHVMGRGIDGLKIFGGKKDREDFLGRLKDLCDKEALSIYAGVVKNIKTLKRYEWCGHSVMMGIIRRPWKDKDTILSYFGKMRKKAIKKYEQFVEHGVKAGNRAEIENYL